MIEQMKRLVHWNEALDDRTDGKIGPDVRIEIADGRD